MNIEDGYVIIFRASYFNKKLRKRIYAQHYGLKAFKFQIPYDKYRA